MDLGTAIRSLRKQADIPQYELAEQCNISQTFLSLIECGKKNPGTATLKKIAEVFNIPLSMLYLLSIDDNDPAVEKKEGYAILMPAIKKLVMELVTIQSTPMMKV